MMRNILLLILVLFAFISCRNSFEKEHQQIVELQQIIDDSESVLQTADTTEVFSYVREIKSELWEFASKYDSLDKETTFKVADYYGNKKTLYFFYDNYDAFLTGIEVSRKQLVTLQKDLDNKIITQQKFSEYYLLEKKIIIDMDSKIDAAVKSIAISLKRLKDSRTEVKEMLSKFKKDKE